MILAKWFTQERNFGDLINPLIIKRFAGEHPKNLFSKQGLPYKIMQRVTRGLLPEYVCVGSILGWGDWHHDVSVVAGAGFMSPNNALAFKPRAIFSLRGQLSSALVPADWQKNLIGFADPGVLITEIFADEIRKVTKCFEVGVLPHYLHKEIAQKLVSLNAKCVYIDIQSDPSDIVRIAASCRVIVTSALHGLILSDSLGVPSTWVYFSSFPNGGDFKFRDYFSSIGPQTYEPYLVRSALDLSTAARRAEVRDVDGIRRIAKNSLEQAFRLP